MAGQGNISVNQTPKYGDKTALDSFKKSTTTTPTTGVPTPKPTAGRPATGGQTAEPKGSQAAVDPAHESLMAELASAYRTHQYWQGVLAQYPSEWSRTYAREAERVFQQKQVEARNATPYFE